MASFQSRASMNNYFITVQGFDIHGSKHTKNFTVKCEVLDGEQVCLDYAAEKYLTDVSIVNSRNLGPSVVEETPEPVVENPETGKEDQMATSKKTAKKKTSKKSKK